MNSALRICALLALPCAGGIIILAEPIMNLLYGSQPDSVAIASPLLVTLGYSVLFVCLVTLSNSILQAYGLVSIPVITMFIGGAAKIICNYILVGNPEINIAGAPIGTLVCYAIITVLNLTIIKRVSHTRGMIRLFIKPVLSTGLMMATAYVANTLFSLAFGEKIGALLAIGAAMLAYLFFLLLLQAIPREDLLLIPKGEKIANFLRIR